MYSEQRIRQVSAAGSKEESRKAGKRGAYYAGPNAGSGKWKAMTGHSIEGSSKMRTPGVSGRYWNRDPEERTEKRAQGCGEVFARKNPRGESLNVNFIGAEGIVIRKTCRPRRDEEENKRRTVYTGDIGRSGQLACEDQTMVHTDDWWLYN
ncbi:hypothetical protein BD410DRAFT_810182 [Rickenella mellea]|uniref:Uncharacterized protein n=1 Tax=Rickenella mellea TaxID=50990 RepID=A0A4Y7PF44_9AGAM|nr:hypothetical protein BD410DRAFT_810182 [Rickenella mellea]